MKYTKKDLNIGGYYKVSWDDKYIIMKVTSLLPEDTSRCVAIYVCSYEGNYAESTPYLSGRKITDVSDQERRWLDYCIKQGKYVNPKDVKPEIINNTYPIY